MAGSRTPKLDIEAYARLTDVERAYLAGFFDGEGSICLNNPRGKQVAYVSLYVSQVRPAVLEKLHRIFGGSLGLQHKVAGSWGGAVYRWGLGGQEEVRIFLRMIRPFAQVKADEIAEALFVIDNRHELSKEQVEQHKENMRQHRKPQLVEVA